MSTPSGANAPYKIVPRGSKFVVVNNAGLTKATFDTEAEARDYQKALYANVPGAAKRAAKTKFTGKARDRVKASFDAAVERVLAARQPIRMSDGKYPILTQQDVQDAWDLRNHSTTHSEAEVVAHIRKAVATLGLTMPKNKDDDRQTAADSVYLLRPHGFVYPAGMPPCSVCNEGPNSGPHVNPAKAQGMTPLANNWGTMVRQDAQDRAGGMPSIRRTHVYTTGQGGGLMSNVRCAACRQPLSASAHTPGMPVGPMGGTLGVGIDVLQPQRAASGDPNAIQNDPSAGSIVMVKHKFEAMDGMSSVGDDYKLCRLCGFPEDDVVHGLDADGQAQEPKTVVKQLAWYTEPREPGATQGVMPTDVGRAFVTQLGGKVILTAPAHVLTDPATLPREIASAWEEQAAANPHFMWLQGRYVEADKPNRNKAVWNSDDLEFGNPSIAHGPINMLHVEHNIVGTVAAAALVIPERQAAAAGEVNTIHALGAIWKYLHHVQPAARQIAKASEENKLWYSMECVSREVACQAPGCSHTQSYRDYMLAKHTRCDHVKQGAPRRFVDPTFDGAGIIIPPIMPGWSGASASVMRQAAMLAEGHEDSFGELSEEEAIGMVAQIIAYSGRTAA